MVSLFADPYPSPPPAVRSSQEIPGRAVRTYRVATLADVDRNLRGLSNWLTRKLATDPESAWDYWSKYRRDMDDLLDARLSLMMARDLAAMESG